MDLNEHELAELEERLYSSIHHAESESTDIVPALEAAVKPPAPGVPAGPLRIVTEKSIINTARQTASSKIKRYWDSLQQQNNRMSYPGISKPKRIGSTEGKANESVDGESAPTKKIFTPYQSILGSMSSVKDDDGSVPSAEGQSEEKQRKKKNTQGDGKRSCNPSETRNRKQEQLKKLKGKKAKALKNRQKVGAGEHRLVATIDLDTSSEEEGEYRSPDPVKQEKKESDVPGQELEDSDPDEVVLIPTAPPPLVCIVDSEDELAKDGFTHPKSKKKKQTKKINSPRCVSPSNSSIMSDDFIGHSDRTRLNDSYMEGITNDEELDCTAPHTVGSLLAGERRGFGDLSRQTRAPSISSDCTVATSSDTTDPDKRNGVKQNSSVPLADQSAGGPKVCSTPKQTLTVKKPTGSKTSKASEDDSRYAATSAKKSKPSTEKLPSSDSSDESEGGNVSSHSKRSKSYQSDTGSTKSLVKRSKKRRKQESEQYSDEDFASMLTDIVQAISENEEEESSDEETTGETVEKSSQEIVEQVSTSIEECVTEHSNDVQEVDVEEPQNQISLPQVEPRIETQAPVVIPGDSNDSLSVVAIDESAPPPLVDLVDENVSDRPQEQEKEEEIIGLRRVSGNPECCWNDEVRKFYNDSWNCEDFNISTVLFNMPRSNKYWPIVHKDKYPDPPKKEIICNNCGERGHMRYKCRNTPKPKTCYMCGLAGHQEVRCPNTLCLKCGEKTKSFLRGCQSCAREQNMICHMCGVRGHGQRNCPDKWRRYHSTIEDNKTLTKLFVRNPNAKHCCICSRAGHQAHACNAAFKIFGQLVPTTEVKSYQHVYPFQRYRRQNHGEKFNQFSDMTDYRLNFDESFAANENSFYYRFAKSVGIVEEKKRKEARKLKRAAKKQKTVEGTLSEPVVIDDDSMKADDQPSSSNTVISHRKAVNEDSNYSFSEFYEDKAANLPQSSDHLPDYIPLISSETLVAPASVEQLRTDAKIFLTKPHAKILLGPIGATFLKDASSKFALKVSISFQSVGNVLLANGLSADQDNFHNELVKFLNDASHQNEQLKLINNVPKATEKTIRYITEHLLLLTRPYGNARILFKRYQHFEEQGANVKTCDKIRRTLNIILFGQYGLRAGREHLTKLQSNLRNLQSTQDVNVSVDFRDEINQHIRYIFTSFDHSNYEDILNEYEQLRKTKKLHKIKPKDLNLPPLSPIKGSDTTENFADDSFNEFKDLNFAERNTAVDFLSSLDEDLILNTSDQLIDPRKTPADFDEHSDSGQLKPDSPPASSLPNPTPKVKHNSKQHRVDTLLEECSHMVKMLNSVPITAKFERICSQTRHGHLSKANYRTLKGIHTVLRGKLNRKLSFRKKGAV
ncbi:uncharacterized protein Zcchc7 [Ochlerotatus camptorhynchus]|uniref:uncharacterized protein Zcchc7 n=1 Tax=Ochlerotatus camptorhynchus TaxID=644619 RepID=UPI0031DD7ABF